MIVVLFFSKLTEQAGDEYVATDQRLMEKARTAPGFVDVKSFSAADGERLTIVWWKDLETLRAWREDPEHRAAQAKGRALWYRYYDMEVAEVVRESHHAREASKRESERAPAELPDGSSLRPVR
jgi:heme-degrading monooxygenase HmoA